MFRYIFRIISYLASIFDLDFGLIRRKEAYPPDLVSYTYDKVTSNLLLQGGHESSLMEAGLNYLNQNNIKLDVFIDCGANIGTTSYFLRNSFNKIYCLEPLNKTFQILKMNTENIDHIECLKFAVGDENIKTTMNYGRGFICGASIKDQANSIYEEEVEVKTLDNLFKNLECSHLTIKLDIENFEFEALKGAKDLIQRYQPVIILEILKREIENGSSPSFKFLQDLGYTFHNPEKKYIGNNRLFKLLPRNSKIIIRPVKKLFPIYSLYTFLLCMPSNDRS
jgi:FkbM family methyltransferase